MTTIMIHNLDDELEESLRVAAARHGNSMEEEASNILRQALHQSQIQRQKGLGSRIHQRFSQIGGVEMEWPARGEPPCAGNVE